MNHSRNMGIAIVAGLAFGLNDSVFGSRHNIAPTKPTKRHASATKKSARKNQQKGRRANRK